MGLFVVYMVTAVILGVAIGAWSERKGHGFAMGFLISLFLSPLVGLIIVAVSEDRAPEQKQAAAAAHMKKCPQCAELVQMEAKVCRYCRFEFPQPPEETPAEKAKRAWEEKAKAEAARIAFEKKERKNRIKTAIVLSVLGILGVLALVLTTNPPRSKPAPAITTPDLSVITPPPSKKTSGPRADSRMRGGNPKTETTPAEVVRHRLVVLRYPSGSQPTFTVDALYGETAWNTLSVGDTVSPKLMSGGADTWILLPPKLANLGAPIGTVVRKVDTLVSAVAR